MTSTSDPTFEVVLILDWYDGIVVGVVRVGRTSTLFLAALLCWAQERRRRVYALLEIERAEVDRLQAAGGDWSRLEAEVEHSFAEANREISIVCMDERSAAVEAEKRVPSSDVLVDLVSDVEEALAPERMRWLDMLVPRS